MRNKDKDEVKSDYLNIFLIDSKLHHHESRQSHPYKLLRVILLCAFQLDKIKMIEMILLLLSK